MVKKAKNKNVPLYQHDSPDFWAFTTILIFPIAMLGALSFGFSSTSAFFFGIYASLGALVANALVEKRLWMFHHKWQNRLEAPDFSFRLAIVTGAILLIVQTSLLVFIFTEPSFDRSMLRLVFDRQCADAKYGFDEFCQGLERALTNAP
jgi:hypothetical protein